MNLSTSIKQRRSGEIKMPLKSSISLKSCFCKMSRQVFEYFITSFELLFQPLKKKMKNYKFTFTINIEEDIDLFKRLFTKYNLSQPIIYFIHRQKSVNRIKTSGK